MHAVAYFFDEPGKPLRRADHALGDLGAGEAVVEVDACGLCHTDLGFFDGSVAPKHELPLILGHEIVGRVIEARESDRVGQTVIVPAVLPCGDCAFCNAGRENACPGQKMPGNDIHGGFASHIRVPAGPLVRVPDALADRVDQLSVVADAVSTAQQAISRAGLVAGDIAFVVGAGGVGAFAIQIAKALGAHVVAIDVREDRLALAAEHGAELTIDAKDLAPKVVRKSAHQLAKTLGIESLRYRIFECSGTTAGQQTAYALLGRAATLVFVGYTPKRVEVRLSNLMAFDATVVGTWGCPPRAYAAVLDLIAKGEVVIEPFIERAPMSKLDDLLDDMAHHRLSRRMVLDPKN